VSIWFLTRAFVAIAQDAVVPPVEPGAAVVQPLEPAGAGVPPQPLEVEEVAPVVVAPAANDERAIVGYQPVESARGPVRPEAPLRINPDWIRGIKSTCLRINNSVIGFIHLCLVRA
jgi:hypothetical protein